jgi:hypothetical protein
VIAVSVRWNLRYGLSYRDVEEFRNALDPDAWRSAGWTFQRTGRPRA